jgi:hypothetical protein
MKQSLLLLLLSLVLPPAFAEESAAAAFFGKLAGEWQGTGEVSAMAADMRMTWEPVLDGRFLRLTMDNRMTGAEGKTWHFKSQAYYRIEKDGTITGTWFDSRGITQPLAGGVEQDAMTIQWGTEAIERGRSHYRLSADALEVTDEVLTKEGEWRTFGRTRLTRKAP